MSDLKKDLTKYSLEDRILFLENKISDFSWDVQKFFIYTFLLGGINALAYPLLDEYGGRDAWMFAVGFSILYTLWIIVYIWRMYERLGTRIIKEEK